AHVARKGFVLDHAPPAFGDGRLRVAPGRWPLDRDRIRLDAGAMAAVRHARRLVLDARLEIAIHGIDEVAAMVLRMEAEDRAAEQSVEHARTPRADAERLGIRPRDVPERD